MMFKATPHRVAFLFFKIIITNLVLMSNTLTNFDF